MGALEWLNRLFRGLGMESLKIELLAIIKDMAYEDPSSPDVQASMQELCQSIVTVLQSKGRGYTLEQCLDDMAKALQEERAEIAAKVVGERIREFARRKKGAKGSGVSIL